MRMPLQGLRLPVKNCGNLTGRITASLRASLAPSSPATSSHFTLGFSVMIAPPNWPFKRSLSLSFSLPPSPLPPPGPFLRCAVAAPFADAAGGFSCRPSITVLRYSARSRYSLNLALMASALRGFFSYFRCVLKYSKAAL
jgi:hypothetical protein